jgi:hypothetical protein
MLLPISWLENIPLDGGVVCRLCNIVSFLNLHPLTTLTVWQSHILLRYCYAYIEHIHLRYCNEILVIVR